MGPYVPRSNFQKSLIVKKNKKFCGQTSISVEKKSQKKQIMGPYVPEPKYKKCQLEKKHQTHLGQTSIYDKKIRREKITHRPFAWGRTYLGWTFKNLKL